MMQCSEWFPRFEMSRAFMRHEKTFLINFLDLLVLCSLAIAQPIFDLLEKNIEFLMARNSNASTIILLAMTVTLLPPGILGFIEFVAAWIGSKVHSNVHRILLWLLVSLLFISPLKHLYPIVGMGWIIITLGFSGLVSELYIRLRSKGISLAYLSPIVMILPIYFLFFSPVHRIFRSTRSPTIEYSKVHATAPIVMIVFDEFPLISLMDDQGQINSRRYPNFAELAQSATWYRNATTIADSTLHALSAAMDGLIPFPERHLLPSAKDHPHSLFTLLGGSYRLKVVENNTRLCPEELSTSIEYSRYESIASLFSDLGVLYLYLLLPSDLTHALPNITLSWKQFVVAEARVRTPAQRGEAFNQMADWDDRLQIFARFIENILPESRPSLHFLHTLLPHAPWEYLPSGKMYTLRDREIRGLQGINDRGLDPYCWTDDRWAILQAYQKHLLQVVMVDRLLGNLISHMKKEKLFEPSLIVITADHGTSFQPGASRRTPGPSNYAGIAAIPLFIKAPYQESGVIDDSNMESIDIFPTVADILGVPLPWPTDGRSALNPSAKERRQKTVILASGKSIQFDARSPIVYEGVKTKLDQFGYSPDDLYKIGRFKQLIGLKVENQHVVESSVKCSLDGRMYLENTDWDSPFIPANICGRLIRDQQPFIAPLNLAVTLNGIISGLTQSYLDHDGTERFSSVLPETDFRSGYNHVSVYIVKKIGSHFELAKTKETQLKSYCWGEVLHFGEDGNAQLYKENGWSPPEEGFDWTMGERADLSLPTSVPKRSIHLEIRVRPYVNPGKVDRQRVRLLVNQHLAAEWELRGPQTETLEIVVPKRFFGASERTVITLLLPDAISPSSIGEGKDRRRLGIAVIWLSLSEV